MIELIILIIVAAGSYRLGVMVARVKTLETTIDLRDHINASDKIGQVIELPDGAKAISLPGLHPDERNRWTYP